MGYFIGSGRTGPAGQLVANKDNFIARGWGGKESGSWYYIRQEG